MAEHDHDHHDHDHHDHGDHGHGTMRVGGLYLWIGVLVGLLIIGALYADKAGWFGSKETPAETPALQHQDGKIVIPKDSPLRSRIAFAPAATRQTGAKLSVPGMVEADPAHTAILLPPLTGRLSELKVSLGDRVTEGQVLAVIDSSDLAQAYADDEKAGDQLALADKSLKRAEEQFAIETLSAHDLDQSRSDRSQAQAEHVRTQARLKAIGAQAVDHHRLVVRAPVSGSVTTLNAAQGTMLNDTAQALLTVSDLSTVWVTALVPEKNIGDVARGQPVDVSLSAYPGQVLHGKVSFVADVVEPDSRRDKVRIAFPNANVALKPNMYATVTLQGTPKTEVVLPTSALLMNNDNVSVFVATGDWTFERRTVQTSLEDGPEVVISAGLQPGEQVVIKGGILLND